MSLHADAVAALTRFAATATTSGQQALAQRYLTHLAAHPDGLLRSCRPDHLTASTVVLSEDGARVLLTLHAKANRWFQFGGHCEAGDPTLREAATREAREESGLAALRVSEVPVHLDEHVVEFCRGVGEAAGDVAAHHLDVRYAAVAPADADHAVSEESLDVRWWPVDALPEAELAEPVARARAWLLTR